MNMNIVTLDHFAQGAKEHRWRKYGVWNQKTLRISSKYCLSPWHVCLLLMLWQWSSCEGYVTLYFHSFSSLAVLICRPVHGLIFLFKWQPGEEPAGSIVQDSRLDHIFFAKQVPVLLFFFKVLFLSSTKAIKITLFPSFFKHLKLHFTSTTLP